MEFDQIYNHLITKRRIFVGKGHACSKKFKLNVKYNKASTSSILCFLLWIFGILIFYHIYSIYVKIMSSLGLIQRLANNFEKCEICSQTNIT